MHLQLLGALNMHLVHVANEVKSNVPEYSPLLKRLPDQHQSGYVAPAFSSQDAWLSCGALGVPLFLALYMP